MTPLTLSPDALKRLVDLALPADPKAGEKVVVGTVDQTGAQIVASLTFKAGWWKAGRWELQAAAHHRWTGDNTIGAKMLLRW
jgi:hypothetical protein